MVDRSELAAGDIGDRHILDRIVESKRTEVGALRRSADSLRRLAEAASAPRDFAGALRRATGVAVIAEVKRRSPAAGDIRADLDPVGQAAAYESGGAAAVSVLTDEGYFGGSLDDLRSVRRAVPIPVLRKDFLIDPVQVYEARGAGADAVLLIVRILEDPLLADLQRLAVELGMATLVEVHDEAELERAMRTGAPIIGINNRDLTTFETRLEVTLELLDRVPSDVLLVSESGIRGGSDVDRLGRAGVDAVLVGEWLVRQGNPTRAVEELAGRTRAGRRS
jgi:indole-3-glycerol phosphate synthase